MPLDNRSSGAPTSTASPDGTATFPLAIGTNPLPVGATQLADTSGNVANAIAAGQLTSAVGRTAFIAAFTITGAGATAGLPVIVSMAGVIGGVKSYIYVFSAGALVVNQALRITFDPPLSASAPNVNITITCPVSGAGGTHNCITVEGFLI